MEGRVMVLGRTGGPLVRETRAVPAPSGFEILIRVSACAICRTDLHLIDGELEGASLPVVPGHQIVGTVERLGERAAAGGFRVGDRVGVPWLGGTCGSCSYCEEGRENLCDEARFTGFHRDGGFADYCLADARYCFSLPGRLGQSASEIAPFLCAGLIGYRTLRMAGESRIVAIYGFGSAARLVMQLAAFDGRKIFAFTRPGDRAGQEVALRLGAAWAGGSDEAPPEPVDAALIFAPVGALVPAALKALKKGGSVVCGGIHMSDIPAFPYRILWGERVLRSVANLTRDDGAKFFEAAGKAGIRADVVEFPLEQANEALRALRDGTLDGTPVLVTEK